MPPIALSASLRQRVSSWQQKAKKSQGEGNSMNHCTPNHEISSVIMRSKTTEKSVSKILSKIKAKHYDAAKNDVLNVLRISRGLTPNLDSFVFDNGDER